MTPQNSSIDSIAEELFEKIHAYLPDFNYSKLSKAYQFAKRAHKGQLRRSGEPYITHPLRTVNILTSLHVDEDMIIAALLHDVPEDTTVNLSEIEEKFGKKVAYLVDGTTKLAKVHYRERMEQRQVESLKKLFIHSAEDLRVILIKLADRLDNMRTLRFITKEEKRIRIARETLEIYVPIANLLGVGEIRMELEDLCFEFLYPVDYLNLKREIEEHVEERNSILEEMTRLTENELQKHHIEAEIIGRPKTLYSIYRKLQTKQNIHNIDDIIAVRIIVPTRKDCYDMLGIIHRLFKPKINSFRDYIAVPKSNGYQSLHTTVFGLNGSVVEFQIRTRYMHLEAEYGVAAHYFYKYSNEQELASIMKQRSNWVQRILEIQKDQQDETSFIEDLKLDVFEDRIFVFSPKGEVIDLPRGASAIDFAYAIHTDVGNHAARAVINGTAAPVTTTLGGGDTVNITTNPDIKPEREWLNFVKTAGAITRIRDYLKKEPAEKKLTIGRRFLQKEFARIGKNLFDEMGGKRVRLIRNRLGYKNLDDILIAIGEGSLNPQKVLGILYEKNKKMRLFINKTNVKNVDVVSKIGIRVTGDNSKNQFREIMRTLNSLKVPILKFVVDKPWHLGGRYQCRLVLIVKSYSELSQIFESLEQLDGIEKISRMFLQRKLWFYVSMIFTALIWTGHPFLIYLALYKWPYAYVLSNIIVYIGFGMLFGLVFYLKELVGKSFPEWAETKYYWSSLYLLTTLALFTVFAETLFFKLHFNLAVTCAVIFGVYALLTANYFSYRSRRISSVDE